MTVDTLQAAYERIKHTYPDARFLTSGEIVHGQNVLWLERQRDLRNRPYLPTLATLIEYTSSGRVKLYRYAAGHETQVVDLQTVFVRETPWCRGEPIFSHCHYDTYIEGGVYWQRRKYVRRYDESLGSDGVEQQAEKDWRADPKSFTLKKLQQELLV